MLRRKLVAAATMGPFILPRAFAAVEPPADREILIGQSAVLSGPLSGVVRSVNAGADLAISAANASGGIHGRKVRIISLDDELKPERTLANFKALKEQHDVLAYTTLVGTPSILAVTGYLKETGTPLIGAYGVGDSARSAASGAAYVIRAGYGREVERIVQHLLLLGISRIGVAHLASPGGEEIKAKVRATLKAQNASYELAGAAGVLFDGSNATEAGAAIAKARPQAVIMFLAGAPSVSFVKAVQDGGAHPMFYAMSIVAGDVVAKALGDQLRGGLTVAQVVPSPWDNSDRLTGEFRQRADKAGVAINYYSFEGYFNGLVLLEALRRSGRAPTRASLHSALRSMRATLGPMAIDFTSAGDTGSRLVELVHVTPDGRFLR